MKKLLFLCTLILPWIASIIFLTGCNKDEPLSLPIDILSPDVFFKDTIFYYGQTEVINISFEEEGDSYTLPAFVGQAFVYFNDDVTLSTAKKNITETGGEIIEQIPSIGYYLVSIPQGTEIKFVTDIYNKNASYAFINTVPTIKACSAPKAIMLDGPYNNHSDKVSQAYIQSAEDVKTVNYIEFPVKDKSGRNTKYIDGGQATNAITKGYPQEGLYNMSFGASLERNGTEIKWDQATKDEKKNYIREYKADIKRVVKRLAEMRKKGVADIVVTIAAGNEGMPNLDRNIINSIVNETDVNGKNILSETEKAVLSEQILIVTDNSGNNNNIGGVYEPNSPSSAAGGKVDISGMTYTDKNYNTSSLEGYTSFAAPKALAIIRDVMAETCLTARQAMQAAKQAIYKSNGTLTRADALEQAKKLFNIKDDEKNLPMNESWFKNTKWDVTESGEVKTTITWSGQGAPSPTTSTDPYKQSYPLEFTSTGYTTVKPSDMPKGSSLVYRVTTPGTLVEESTYSITENGVSITLKYTRTYSLTSANAQTINVETKMDMTTKSSGGGMTMTAISKMTAQGKGTRK